MSKFNTSLDHTRIVEAYELKLRACLVTGITYNDFQRAHYNLACSTVKYSTRLTLFIYLPTLDANNLKASYRFSPVTIDIVIKLAGYN